MLGRQKAMAKMLFFILLLLYEKHFCSVLDNLDDKVLMVAAEGFSSLFLSPIPFHPTGVFGHSSVVTFLHYFGKYLHC